MERRRLTPDGASRVSLCDASCVASFVLVHGAWHGPWCWQFVESELMARGHRALSVDLRGDDWTVNLEDCVRIVVDAAGEADDLVLVGHSLGGIVVPLVPQFLPVRRLSFVCGLIPRPGRSINDVLADEQPFGASPERASIRHPDSSSSWEPEAAIRAFFHDCDRPTAEWAARRLRRQVWTTSQELCPLTEWPAVESQYIVCRDDRSARPEWSRRRARDWIGIDAVELPGGHDPMLSRPQHLVDVLTIGL